MICGLALCCYGLSVLPDDPEPWPVGQAGDSFAIARTTAPVERPQWTDNSVVDSPKDLFGSPCGREQAAYEMWHLGQYPLTSGMGTPAESDLDRLRDTAADYRAAVLGSPGETSAALAATLDAYVDALSASAGRTELEHAIAMVEAALEVNGAHQRYQAACAGRSGQ